MRRDSAVQLIARLDEEGVTYPQEQSGVTTHGNVAVSQGKLPRDVMASFNKKWACILIA
jgi:hypothetical protein